MVILLKSIDADWIVGQVGEREGMFPRSFVKVKIPLPGEVQCLVHNVAFTHWYNSNTKVYRHTCSFFTIFTKGDNLCDFLFL